jgi:hypothetical protein
MWYCPSSLILQSGCLLLLSSVRKNNLLVLDAALRRARSPSLQQRSWQSPTAVLRTDQYQQASELQTMMLGQIPAACNDCFLCLT